MYTSSIVVDQVIDALAAFIAPFAPAAQVIRAQVNRVAMPPSPCVVLKEVSQVDLSVPYEAYQPDDDTATIIGPTQIDIQVDFYGQQAGDFCKAFKSAMRSGWGYSQFPANIKPLYATDGMQAPLVTGEQQYESRWTITARMQYNPIVTVPQEFADVATPNTVEAVDVIM